jgi:hypothetical protein
MRTALIAASLSAVILLASCDNLQQVAGGEADSLFPPPSSEQMLPEQMHAGDAVPKVDLGYKAEWDTLCGQCHAGPAYNSRSGMTWEHREGCLSAGCMSCHSSAIHKLNRQAGKASCFDCHIKRYLELDCVACHTSQLVAANSPHDASYALKHPVAAADVQAKCLNCHGSQSWCDECHGVTMPHPADIATNHEELGKTASCVACHGRNSCITCHSKHGVAVKQAQADTAR